MVGIDGEAVGFHAGDDRKQPALHLEDGAELHGLEFLRQPVLEPVEMPHVVLGICDLFLGKNEAAPIAGTLAFGNLNFEMPASTLPRS